MNMRKNAPKEGITRYVKTISYCILILILYGCNSPEDELFFSPEKFRVWPEPPEKPRIRYLGELSTQKDLEKPKTFDLSELIFGKKKVGVLISPYGLAISNDYKLYVTDNSAGTVHIFDLRKRQYKQFDKIDSKEKLQKPVGIAIADKQVYVVDSMLHKVCVFNSKEKHLFSFGEEQLKRPSGIAYKKDTGEVLISDTASHKIMVFTNGGRFVREIGSRGINAGQFNFPTQICVDEQGKIYVSDTLNYRIQIFSNQLIPQMIFGHQGDKPGDFAHPCGIASDSYGNIYVSDRQFENIQIFNSHGQILMSFGREGTQPGQFWLPSDICIDDHNRIYVADTFNKRIQVFQLLEQKEQ